MIVQSIAAEERDGKRLHFLDGLRGWGAVFVLNRHLFGLFLARGNPAFDNFTHWMPFVFDGRQAVMLFFLVSGFAVTSPYFCNHQKRELLLDGAVRRYPRLVIPVLGSVLFAYGLLSLDWMYHLQVAEPARSVDWLGEQYRFEADILTALRFAIYDAFFNYGGMPTYNNVLWTMSYELVGSLFLFALLALIGRWQHRGWIYLLLIALLRNSIYLPFVVGVALADVYHGTLPLPERLSTFVRRVAGVRGIGLLLLTAAIVLAFAGNGRLLNFRGSTGLTTVAVLLVLAGMSAGPARSFLTSRFSQWVGRLSFPIYLVHVPILCSWSSWLFLVEFELGLPMWIILVSVAASTFIWVIVAATIFEKWLEVPALLCSRWIGKNALRTLRRIGALRVTGRA